MDNGTIITTGIIILIIALPFILAKLNNSKKHKAIVNELKKTAQNHQVELGVYDLWKKSGFGFDSTQTNVIGFKKSPSADSDFFVSLSEVQKVHTVVFNRTEDDNLVVEVVKLEFQMKKSHDKRYFEFFNVDADASQLSDEIILAKKWEALIDDKLN